MGASTWTGPHFTYGDMGNLPSSYGSPVPDPNSDACPSVFFMGTGVPDVRYPFLKDKVQGFAGQVPSSFDSAVLESINAIPAAFGSATLVASAVATSATLTLKTTQAYGIAINIPIIPFSGGLNSGAPVICPIVLDFGFCYGTTTSVAATANTLTVLDSTLFYVGMPLVIPGAAGTNKALLTFVTAIPSATTVTMNDPALAAGSFPIGVGNLFGPSEIEGGFIDPTAHLPYRSKGPGLFFDAFQGVSRVLSYTAAAGATATTCTVTGYDIYWQPQTETVTLSAGATVYGLKAFKGVVSAVLNAADGAHAYSIGTSDVFGFAYRSDFWEEAIVCWAGGAMTANTGWTVADTTNPATATTGDVRGTIQASAQGGGSGIGTNNSNGAVSTITISGRRLYMAQRIPARQMTLSTRLNPQILYGQTPV